MATVTSPTMAQVAPKTNIFTVPIKAKSEAAEALRKKNHQKAWAKLLVALVVVGVYSFEFFYPQLTSYLGFETTLAAQQKQISEKESVLSDLKKKRDEVKSEYDEQFKEEQSVLNAVLPKSTDKVGLIRLLENFATNLNTAYPPFELNTINFQDPVKEKGYVRLPFSTTVKTTRANFDRFLELIRLSGNAEKDKEHIRLMDISNITLRYLGVDKTGKDLGVDFTVQMNAYSSGN